MPESRLKPKLITVLKQGYSSPVFFKDLTAGIIVGIVALPLAIAFAIASGVTPEQGLYTAIVAGFLISLLSGSRVQIGGPTGAFIVIIYGIVQKFGYDGLAIATIMAGVLLVLMGFAKLGTIIKYIPYPVTVGFTGGIALIIATGQVRDLLGLHMEKVPAEFIEKIVAYSEHAGSITPVATVIGIATIAIVFLWPRVTQTSSRLAGGHPRDDRSGAAPRSAGRDDRQQVRHRVGRPAHVCGYRMSSGAWSPRWSPRPSRSRFWQASSRCSRRSSPTV